MANILKQIKIGNTTYDIEPVTSYLPLSGGTMTGPIYYQGTKAKYGMIKWIDNTADNYGNGIRIGGGGATIIGGGESADLPSISGGDEVLYLMNDGNIDFYSNCQEGLSSSQHMTFDVYGTLNVPTNVVGSSNSNRLIFRHLDGQNCNNNYDLYLQYHQRNTKIYLNGTDYYIENGSYYNGTAAAANSVAWGNVSGKPSTFPPIGHGHSEATQSGSGFMSSADKKKLDGIESEANKITVDTSLSSSSSNPVRNSTIYSAFSNAVHFDHGFYTYGEAGSWRLQEYHATGNSLDIRYGKIDINAQEKTYSVSFTKSFGGSNYAIVCGIYRHDRNSWFWSPLVTNRTNTGFSVYVKGNYAADNSGRLLYIAIKSN